MAPKPKSRDGMVALINCTGAATVKGTVVKVSSTVDMGFALQTTEYDAIGVVADGGVADGSYAWLIVSGIAEVLLENGLSATRGNFVKCSAVDGRADASTTAPIGQSFTEVGNHFKEIGHCLESKTAGTDVLCRVMLHFN